MIDRSISMEKMWFHYMRETGCQQKLQIHVVGICTPATKGSWVDPAKVHHKLEEAKCGGAYQFGTDEAKGAVNITAEWAKAIAGERAPVFKGAKDNTFLANIQKLMENMLKYQDQPAAAGSSSDVAGIMSVGKDAMTAHYTKLEKDLKANATISLGSLKVFDTFSWMLDENQASVHKRAVAYCFSKPKAAGPAYVPPPPCESARSSVKREPATNASTANLFKKKKKTA